MLLNCNCDLEQNTIIDLLKKTSAEVLLLFLENVVFTQKSEVCLCFLFGVKSFSAFFDNRLCISKKVRHLKLISRTVFTIL